MSDLREIMQRLTASQAQSAQAGDPASSGDAPPSHPLLGLHS
ncbi:hypothetical protein NZK27_05685 [Synechococcus sp. FGCU-3]|nr:hypothetical protein [Synechococcus sp. FGCU3]